jgi:hypothetical protein
LIQKEKDMKLFYKLGLLGLTLVILTILALLPVWLTVEAEAVDLIPASAAVSDARVSDARVSDARVSDARVQPQVVITFTPVATLYLPLVTRVGTVETAPGGFDVRLMRIEYDPTPGPDVEGEYVDLQNFGATAVNMTDWTLRDAATNPNTFTFPSFTLDVGATVRVWVKDGLADATNLYWGRGSAVWNNTGDTATLSSPSATEIDSCTYPGGAPGFFDCEP